MIPYSIFFGQFRRFAKPKNPQTYPQKTPVGRTSTERSGFGSSWGHPLCKDVGHNTQCLEKAVKTYVV